MKKVLVCTGGFGAPKHETENFQLFVEQQNWLEQKSEKYLIDFYKSTPHNEPSRIESLHPRLRGKIPKMLIWEFKPNYDYYVWVDSRYNIRDISSIEKFVDYCLNSDACFFKHSIRSTVREEVETMYELIRDNHRYFIERYAGEPMKEQLESYETDSTWNDNILFECGLFVYNKCVVSNREHNLMKEWFYHNCIWSIQDQISLPYLLHKFGTKYKILLGSVWDNEYFVRF